MHRLWTRRPFRFSCSTWSSRQSSLRWLATADRHPTCGQQHLVWTVLDAVAELDLLAVYADYRDDGAASPPTDDGAALARRYARGNRSSRGIEWACMADSPIASSRVPRALSLDDPRVPRPARIVAAGAVLRRARAVRSRGAGVV